MKKGIDYIGVCVVFYCHDGQGKLLLHKRSKKCQDEQGNWDPGGGSLEHGETFEQALRREIKEEYAADVISLNFLETRNVLRKNNGKKTHWVALLFTAQVNPKQVKLNEPDYMDEIGWFNLKNLPSPLHSQFTPFLETVRRTGVFK